MILLLPDVMHKLSINNPDSTAEHPIQLLHFKLALEFSTQAYMMLLKAYNVVNSENII